MYYLKSFILTGLLCLFFFSCIEKEVIRTEKNISIPLLNESDTIMITPRPGYTYVVNVFMDTIRGPQPTPQPGPPIKIPTQPGYAYDVRVFMDTIRNPPLPGPLPQISMSSGQVVSFPKINQSEDLNVRFSPTRSDMDTIHIEVYNPITGETEFIPCIPNQMVIVPCGGEMISILCGSYVECGDSTSTDQ
jgi:hypothetical protein